MCQNLQKENIIKVLFDNILGNKKMSISSTIILLIVTLTVLVIASQFTIKSIEKFMEITKMAEGSAGFILLSVMSSFPEIMVAIFAVIDGEPGVSIGDIFGSHLFNLGVVLGLLAIFGQIRGCRKETLEETVDFIFLITIIPLTVLIFEKLDIFLVGKQLLGFFLIGIYILMFYSLSKKRQDDISHHRCQDDISISSENFSPDFLLNRNQCQDATLPKSKKVIVIIKILIGGIAVIVSSRFVVTSALDILELFNILPIVIGAKLIAIGTSLPELIFCYYAAKEKKIALALGDLFGANLTTITVVLGIILITAPFSVNLISFLEMIFFLICINIIIWRGLSKGGLSRKEGFLLLGIYLLFQFLL